MPRVRNRSRTAWMIGHRSEKPAVWSAPTPAARPTVVRRFVWVVQARRSVSQHYDNPRESSFQSGGRKYTRHAIRLFVECEAEQQMLRHIVRMLIGSHQCQLGSWFGKDPAIAALA